jgi:hypothetical protein
MNRTVIYAVHIILVSILFARTQVSAGLIAVRLHPVGPALLGGPRRWWRSTSGPNGVIDQHLSR